MTDTPILDSIKTIQNIRELSLDKLESLSRELRQEVIKTVAITGGHLGAGLGVVELTIALHHVFNTPKDLIVWDIGHQTYPHKILTGRRDRMLTLRQAGGLSGFTKRTESEFDVFGGGHSSTSISSSLGMAIGRDLNNEKKEVIAVIGDGSLSAGIAYEAMNNAGALKKRLIVILNDNDMSISPAVGAMNNYLSKLISSKTYLDFRTIVKKSLQFLPQQIKRLAKKFERNTKDIFTDGNFFEEMGFYYIGPIDGHDLSNLIPILKNIRDDHNIHKPILIHVSTEKGKGFESPEPCNEKYHAVSKFDLKTKIQKKSKPTTLCYNKIYAESLIREARKDKKIVAITAAMPSGTALDLFQKEFPERMFDVGIAEQHAVEFAAGLACEGLKPYVTIYSTFLQRAYDQIVNDVAIQSLPVKFAIDRAGFVGGDGPTHCGAFDITFLTTLPNFIVMAPSDEAELSKMVATSAQIDHAPCAFRYPRGTGTGVDIPENPEILEIGKGRVMQEGGKVAILSLGTRLHAALKAANRFKQQTGITITVADARFAKPLDRDLISTLAKSHELLITTEEGSIGGFGAHVLNCLNEQNLLSDKLKVKNLFYPDRFIEQSTQDAMNKDANLDADGIYKTIIDELKMSV
jgi:1-deoxy-D-xylulose-5-phosphate synthase